MSTCNMRVVAPPGEPTVFVFCALSAYYFWLYPLHYLLLVVDLLFVQEYGNRYL